MDLIEEIIALLGAKFQGVRKDVLANLAGNIALQVESKEEAEKIVAKLSAEKVSKFGQSYRSEIDKEIQKSNKTYEESLKKKFDFIEKKQEPDPKEPPVNGAITLEQIQALLQQTISPLTQRMDAFDAKKLGDARRETYVNKLKEAKLNENMINMLTSQFDMMSFKDDESFNTFLSASQPTIEKLAQDASDSLLRQEHKPNFGTTNNEGVSKAVSDYIASKSNGAGGLGGKTI